MNNNMYSKKMHRQQSLGHDASREKYEKELDSLTKIRRQLEVSGNQKDKLYHVFIDLVEPLSHDE